MSSASWGAIGIGEGHLLDSTHSEYALEATYADVAKR
jgi:hypothetical protein